VIIHQPVADPTRLLGAWGRRPADRLASGLGAWLDDRFHLVRRPWVEGAWLSGVVVVPGGTWTLADLAGAGKFRKRNDHWYRWQPSTRSWVPWGAEEVAAGRLAGHRLERTLDAAGLPATVQPVLVTGSKTDVSWDEGQRPGVLVHRQDGAASLAALMTRDEVLTRFQVERITALLDPHQPLPRPGDPGPA